MKKTLCDKCGAEIFNRRGAWDMFAKVDNDYNEPPENRRIDLCANCYKAFIEWLEEEGQQ